MPPAHDAGVNSLTFCDFSGFYTPTGGGIRTYHQAKLDWFASQDLHNYVLLHPGPRFAVERVSPHASTIAVYGGTIRGGYRLPMDFRRIREVVAGLRPDVLETGDPWVSGPLGLLFKRWGYARMVSSFYHSDPIRTYLEPWTRLGVATKTIRENLGRWCEGRFFRVQRMYDVTLTSSAWIQEMLRGRGVTRTLRVPFGVDPAFLEVGRARQPRRPRTRLLYVGRLQADKAIDLLIDAVPDLLHLDAVELTIVGDGPEAARIERLVSPRVRLTGFVTSRQQLARIFSAHDVLLAPGPYETFGLGPLEGLAAGLSVVAPDAGGTRELLKGLSAPHIFKRDNRDDFVRAVRAAVSADPAADAHDGIALAERYGTWPQAIGREIDSYCAYLSPSTT